MNEVHSYLFLLLPLAAWVVSGCLKFALNLLRYGAKAREHIGNGGFPSTHTSVVTSITMAIGVTVGWDSPLFGLGVALLMVVVIDATGVRTTVGTHAERINTLSRRHSEEGTLLLREKQGHTKLEIIGGLGVGTVVGWFASWFIT